MVVGALLAGHVLSVMTAKPDERAEGGAETAPEAAGEPGPAAAEAVESVTPEPERETGRPPRRYHDTLLYTNYLGLGGGARWGRRGRAAGDVPGDMSWTERTATGLASVQGRLAGFTSGAPRLGRGRRILTPELFLSLEFGATRWSADGGHTARSGGVTIGVHGVLRLGLGRTMSRKLSPYVKGQLDQRFATYVRDTAEGNFLLATLRGSAGIVGRTAESGFVLLAGPALDGVTGAQALGRRSAVLQLMAGGELAMYAHPKPRLSLAWVGDARTTVAGERWGGRRVEWRATFDMMLGLPLTQARPRYLALFATYWGTEIRASPERSPVVTTPERRLGHAALLGLGVGI